MSTEEPNRRNERKFRWLAAFYDAFDLVFLLDPKSNPRHALAAKIPNDALRILDVCTGTANNAIAVAEANPQNRITGVDLSPDMIAVAERKIRQRDLQTITIHHMNATGMDFQPGTFDIVMISFGLHEFDRELMGRVLREMQRVLKRGGKLYIVDYERGKGFLRSVLFDLYLRIFEPKHLPQFLAYNWAEILGEVGLELDELEICLFSKLISATKPIVPTEHVS